MNKKLEEIHKTSLQILGEIGIKLHHPEIFDLLNDHGFHINNQIVCFSEDQIWEWISKAPSQFTLYARNPKNDLFFGGDNHVYGAGYGCPEIIEINGNHRNATLEDYIKFTKLIQNSPFINLAGGIVVQPFELKDKDSRLAMLYAALLYSDKCLMGLPGSAEEVEQQMDLIALLMSGTDQLKANPAILTLISSLSPLQIDFNAMANMLVCAKYHQPMIISPGPIAGATGPISLAGNIAMGNAEALAGIVIAQIIQPGVPVIYGLQAAAMDMKTGYSSIGTPAFSLEAKYCAALARFYKLPSRGGGASTDAKNVSTQSGYESMLSLHNSRQQSINLIIHSAGILDSYMAMSYEQFMVDQEMISMVEYFFKDIKVNDETLSFDIIKQVGHGGLFLNHRDTFKKCRTEPWHPEISLRGGLKETTPDSAFLNQIEKKLNKEFANYQKPDIDPEIKQNMQDYLNRCGLPSDLLAALNSN
jgi:trimethylamine---corrinoid protein Co-methyltransferase